MMSIVVRAARVRRVPQPRSVTSRDRSRDRSRRGIKTRGFSRSSFQRNGHALLSPCATTFYLSRRSLQHVQEEIFHLQLEYPPVFRAPVTGGAMFLTGDDTTITGFSFSL